MNVTFDHNIGEVVLAHIFTVPFSEGTICCIM